MAIAPAALEFGIYRDGDNNLDHEQALVINQALSVSSRDPSIEFVVEDTTARRGFAPEGELRTETYVIRDGEGRGLKLEEPHDPSSRENLAAFVARTLDHAEQTGARQTWIELVDHGGGDGGGLESATHGSMMSERDIAGAIADGVAAHARAHPEDASRNVDGVVANQCLMNTLGFADELSRTGVRWLAASPEIMIAPGVPSTVAAAIANNVDDPNQMARDLVATTMAARYGIGGQTLAPAAAFSVLDTSPQTMAHIREQVKKLDDDLIGALRKAPSLAPHVRSDERAVHGMARCREDVAAVASRSSGARALRKAGRRRAASAADS